MRESSWQAPESSSARALLAWGAVLALAASGCARAHHDPGRASDDGRRPGERTTRDPATADDDDEESDEDLSPVPVAPRPSGAAAVPAGGRPVAPPVMDEPSIGELMAELFVEYQRDGSLRCPCHVAIGVYATLEECLDASARQRPKVNDCLDETVPPEALKELRDWVRCITQIKREHNACLEIASCDDPMSCRIDTARCRFPNPMLVSTALNHCPQAITIGP